MTTLKLKDFDGNAVYLSGTGAGTSGDPFVPDNGITGTVTANLSATDNTVLDNIDSATSRLTSSATNIAPGSALATTSLVMGGRYDSTQKTLTNGQEASFAMSSRGAMIVATGADSFATKDAGPSWTTVWGVSGAAVVSADMTTAAAVTDAPTSGQKICLDDLVISAAVDMNVLVEEETSGTDLFKIYVPANGVVQLTMRGKMKVATADKKVTCKASVAGGIAVTATYHSEA